MPLKYQLSSSSIYYEGSSVAKNLLNIKDSETIQRIEKELLEEAYGLFFDELDTSTIFDENYFVSLHRRTFESLYPWAGRYREFNMAKGESRFCQALHLHSSSKKIFDDLKKENYLKDYTQEQKNEFVEKVAYYKCELIALHPFYELNGRVTRMFIDMIVAYHGYQFVDYSHIEVDEYIDASIECVQFANCEKMQKIIFDGLK